MCEVQKCSGKVREKMRNNLIGKKLIWLSMFIALSVVGATIKIPAIVGSIALDSFPALLAASILGGGAGAVAGALGHLISAMLSGFQLGPMHFLISMEMAILVSMFGVFWHHHKKVVASLFFILGNSFIAPLPFLFILGKGFYWAVLPSLILMSAMNTGLALLLIPRLVPIISNRLFKGEIKG
jgi:uncharacterized membrane protein